MTGKLTRDIVVIDEAEQCPYLPEQTARMPLRMPLGKITPEEADERFAQGHRRTGEFIYQTRCPSCQACQAIRLDCREFGFSRNLRRVLNQGERRLEHRIGPMTADVKRVRLFNKHRRLRGLSINDRDIDLEEYIWGFVRSCFQTFEITYWMDGDLVGVAVCDAGKRSLSAVYTFYDPEIRGVSVGTYSILRQVLYCRAHQMDYLYLGFYVEGSPHMQYKARFRPHERLIHKKWTRFD